MKVLITFEHSSLPIHAIDLISILKNCKIDIDFLMGKTLPTIHDPLNFYKKNTNIITEISDFNKYDVWFFDLSSWESPKTPFLDKLHTFKGSLICVNYEDGYQFFKERIDDYIVDKTLAFVNNALYVDRNRYDKRIRNKLVLTTSYISNSQDFAFLKTPFKNKIKRSIFTGSLTGSSETGSVFEDMCRINIPMKIIKEGRECIYSIHGYDPSRKFLFDSFNKIYKKNIMSRTEFIETYINSMIVLSIKGNGHTVNRFFEGLACGSLVFSTPFDSVVEFIGQGNSGKDYVEINFSGDDVVEKIDYYLNNLDESEKIANSGRNLWETYSKRDENGLLPERVSNQILSSLYFRTGLQFK